MIRVLSLAAVLLGLSFSYSYSDTVYGVTNNAAETGLTWDMNNVLPTQGGLIVNGVIYNYTVEKEVEDPFKVHVQNENATGDGYVFRETDDWSGLPSGSINKFIPIDNIPKEYWGKGSIEVEGKGKVKNQVVMYNYRIDTAEQLEEVPDFIPEVPVIDVYNVLDDDTVKQKEVDRDLYTEEQKDKEERLEKAKKAANKAIGIGNTAAQQAMFQALSIGTNINSYYAVSIEGGTYRDSVSLEDTKLPENKRGLRNGFAQQVLHTKMVDMQWR